MRPTVSQYAEALEALSLEGVSAEALAKNFLGFLKRRGEYDQAKAVTEQLAKRTLFRLGAVPVTVVTAREAGTATKALLARQAERVFPGKSVRLQYEVDAAIIGGARFRSEEVLYDATVAHALHALKKVMHA